MTDKLDPSGWDPGERAHALDWRNVGLDPRSASATGTSGALVGSTGPFATLAGRYTLDAAGSATDAVLTTAFTQIALSLGSWVSYAGLFGMVHHEAATGATTSVSAGFRTFAGETHPLEIPPAPQPSGRTALVPGFIAGAYAAHTRSGRLPWEQLWSPARYLLERGVPVTEHLSRLLAQRADVLTRTDEGRAAFAAQGRLPRAGELFTQQRLAATAAALAEHGPDWMYQGPWAEHFVSAVRREEARRAWRISRATGPAAANRHAGPSQATRSRPCPPRTPVGPICLPTSHDWRQPRSANPHRTRTPWPDSSRPSTARPRPAATPTTC